MRHYGKRLLAVLLALALCLGLTEGAAYAQDEGALYIRRATNEPVGTMGEDGTIEPAAAMGEDGTVEPVAADAIEVSGDGSVGSLLAEGIAQGQEEQSELEAQENQVTGIEIKGQGDAAGWTADIEYHVEDGVSAEAVVAIYEEGSLEMKASGKAVVTSDDETASVTLGPAGAEMPQYFLATAYLLDAATHAPLGSPYTTEWYTQEMQELLRSTTADYEEGRVLNLDNDVTTNFAVYNEETTVVEQSAGTADENVLTDNGDGTYTVRNAGASIANLQPGEPFSYNYADGTVLLVKVKAISLETEADGTKTVTITGDDGAEADDYFDYIKIDGDSSETPGVMEIDDSELDENLTRIDEASIPQTMAMKEATLSHSLSYTMGPKDKDKEDDELVSSGKSVKLTGNMTLSFTAVTKYYIGLTHHYFSFEFSYALSASIDITAEVHRDLNLSKIKLPFVGGLVHLNFKPAFVVEASGALDVTFKTQGTIGAEYDSEGGWDNLSKWPETTNKVKLEGSIYVGLKLPLSLDLVDEELGEAKLEASVGVTIEGEMLWFEESSYEHECDACVSGTISAEFGLTASLTILGEKVQHGSKWTIVTAKTKEKEFYYSITHNKYGWGTCPYIRYPVTIKTKDEDGEPVDGAAITVKGKDDKEEEVITEGVDPVTNTKGELVIWMKNGTHTIYAKSKDYNGSKKITVKDTKKTAKIKMESNTYDVTVRVQDEETGEPVPGVIVAATSLGKEAKTDDAGEAVLKLKSGTHKLKLSSENYNGEKSVTVNREPKEVTVKLKRVAYGTVHLSAEDEDGNPVPGAEVTCKGLEETVTTDSDGTAEFRIKTGDWTLGVSAEGLYGKAEITVAEGDENHVTVTMKETHFLHLRAQTASGSAVSGAKVYGTGLAEDPLTGTDGTADIPLATGTYSIQVYKKGLFGSGDVTIGDTDAELTVTMQEGTVFWTLNEGTLHIFGEGEMDKDWKNIPLWNEEKEQIEHVIIEPGITNVGISAFSQCRNLVSVEIPDTVTEISGGAFYGSGLSEIDIPASVKEIRNAAFVGTRIERIVLPDGLEEISNNLFDYCPYLREVQIPDSVTSIGNGAFSSCDSLREIEIPDSVTFIGESAFAFSGLRQIRLSDSLTAISDRTFEECDSLTSVDIPSSVSVIGVEAFAECDSLRKIYIPEGVTQIKARAFKHWANYWEGDIICVLPRTLRLVGADAFAGHCWGDFIVYFKGDRPEVDLTSDLEDIYFTEKEELAVFYNEGYGGPVYYPAGNSTWEGIQTDPAFNRKYENHEDEDGNVGEKWYPVWIPYDPETTDFDALLETDSETDTEYVSDLSAQAEQTGTGEIAYDAELSLDLTGDGVEDAGIVPEPEGADGQDAEVQDTAGTEGESEAGEIFPAEDIPAADDVFPEEDILAEEEGGADAANMSDTVDIADTAIMEDTTGAAAGTEDAAGQPGDTLIVEERTLEVFAAGDKESGTSGQIHSFSDKLPNTDYLFVEVVSAEADDLLAPDNLLYIAQGTTDETGAVSFDCRPRGGHGGTTTQQLFGPSDKVITEADVAIAEMTANGGVQYPDVTVTYTDEQGALELEENEDYVLSGNLRIVKAGDYTLTVTGIGEYSGTVTKSFTVKEQGGTVKPTDPSDPTPGQTTPSTGDHEHVWEPWETVYEADVFFGKLIMHRCSICKKSQTRYTGQPLPATISLSATSFPLKVKQSYKVKVSGLAKGDSVTSWTSSNPKVAKVSSSGKITGKKKGKATITVRLMSGLSRKITVKVQTGKVKTKKINVSSAKVTLKKGGTWKLAPAITPVTSQDKVNYVSSNKKVATVSKKGVIKAKKPGKAKITIRSGKKKKVVTVTVTK